MAWDLPYYLHTEYQLNVSAYFRDTLRWQTTRFTSSYFDLTAKAESHLIYKRGFLTLGLIVWS